MRSGKHQCRMALSKLRIQHSNYHLLAAVLVSQIRFESASWLSFLSLQKLWSVDTVL